MRLFIFVFSTICLFAQQTETLDNSMFNQLCEKTLQSEESFNHFRGSQFCTQIVDTVWESIGWQYADIISNRYPKLLNWLDEFRKNDSVGNAGTISFGPLGNFCPTTLRYISVAGELESLFGTLDGKTIVEIGVGYGGLCRILSSLFSFKEYIVIDYPAVLELTQRYLEALNVKNVRYLTPSQVSSAIPCDLVISNYAFSECFRQAKLKYIDAVLNHSKCGYMICNDSGEALKDLDMYFHNENVFLESIPEIPQTGNGNYLVFWK